jgi:Cu(I)/Ag(I) efflux system membrane fusion protein
MELRMISGGKEDVRNRRFVTLTEEAARAAEVRLAPVERKAVSAEIRLFGQLDYDPSHTSQISAFMPGVIDRVYVKRAGQFVRWGERLFDIYSSDLYATEQQLAEVMKQVPGFLAFHGGSPYVAQETAVQARRLPGEKAGEVSAETRTALQTLTGIRAKLRLLGLPKRDIDELMKKAEPTGIAGIYSPMYGIVIRQNAFEGTFVNQGVPILTIADPKYIWARLEAYESDYPWIRKGQEVSFQTDAFPGESFTGKVVYVDPILFDTKKRTFNVGVQFPDQGGRLRSGMVVRASVRAVLSSEGQLAGGRGGDVPPLVIPSTAPLMTGKRAVVYVAQPGKRGTFESREIILGPRAGDYYVVMSGLRQGEQVVVNGSFKIDSAAQILAKSSFMSLKPEGGISDHHRPGGSEAMERDYIAERRQSRTREVQPETRPSFTGDPPLREISEPPARLRTGPTVRRRLPGGYADTTRESPMHSFDDGR